MGTHMRVCMCMHVCTRVGACKRACNKYARCESGRRVVMGIGVCLDPGEKVRLSSGPQSRLRLRL